MADVAAGGIVLGRRQLLAIVGLPFAALAAIGMAQPGRTRPAEAAERGQADDAVRADLIAEAFEQRRRAVEWGDQPYGAVVVQRGVVVGEGPSRVVLHGDPTAHAEMEAVRDACRRLATRDLSDCELYATSPPCRMCEAAAYWARIARIYHGSTGTDAGTPRLSAC